MQKTLQNTENIRSFAESLVDTSDRALCLIDKNSREILYVNQAYLDLQGVSIEEIYNRPCNEVVCKMGHWIPKECVCLGIKEESRVLQNADNKYYCLISKAVTIGEHEAIAFYIHDVTAIQLEKQQVRRLQEDAIRGYQRQIDMIMKMNPDAVSTFQVNLTKNKCYNGSCNYQNLLRLQDKGTVDGYFEDALAFIPKEEHSYIQKMLSRDIFIKAFQAGQTQVSADCHYMINSLDERVLRTTISMVENPINHDIEGVMYSLDLTQRELYNNILHQLFEKEYEGAAILNKKYANYTLIRFSYDQSIVEDSKNLDYEQGLERLIKKFVAAEDQEEYRKQASIPQIMSQLEHNGTYSFTAYYINDQKEKRLKKISYYYLDRYHDLILCVTEDITEITNKEQRRVEQLKKALLATEQATEAKTTFLANISHDMRTPLNGVLGFAKLALAASTIEDKNRDIEKIISSGDFLLQLINDTLDLSKIESNSVTLTPEVFLVTKLVEGVVTSVEELAKEKKIHLIVDCNHLSSTESVNADRMRLQQVLVNLLSNAIKFTPCEGHVTLKVETLEHPYKCTNCKFTVQDDGCGMSEQFLPHAFEPFTQERNKYTKDVVGTGLGLAIVHRIVSLMGGMIELDSKVGQGTRFEIYLPLERVDYIDEPSPNTEYDINLVNKHVLLCEDHMINRELAIRLLEYKGMQVTCAENGKVGVDTFDQSTEGYFDAILMDVRMPVMDGIEATQRIRQLKRQDAKVVPIIAMTANAFENDKDATSAAGMNAHVSKPINPEVLYSTIAAQITQSQMKQQEVKK